METSTRGGGLHTGGTLLAGCTAALLAALLASCAAGRTADLEALYGRAARRHDGSRNPVILIPGILGSRLVDDESGRVVWGAFTADALDPSDPEELRTIALPIGLAATVADAGREPAPSLIAARDRVRSDGALDRVKLSLFGLTVEARAYHRILTTLGIAGYRDEALGRAGVIDYGDDHFTCFQFDYDWRRDIAENASRLFAFVQEKRAYVEAELRRRTGREPVPVRFDIVAHSMGGLVARAMLRYGDELWAETAAGQGAAGAVPSWKGAPFVERLVLVGTPNSGSAEALLQLVEGYRPGPFLPFYPPALLGTFPSIYELLPRDRHRPLQHVGDSTSSAGSLFDIDTWERFQWGLLDPQQERVLAALLPDRTPVARRRLARAWLARCLERARRVHAALDRPAPPPPGTRIVLFAGDSEPTVQTFAVDGRGELSVVVRGPGDGIVLRASALADERTAGDWTPSLRSPVAWDEVHLLFRGHLALTSDLNFADNLLYLLLESPAASPARQPASRGAREP